MMSFSLDCSLNSLSSGGERKGELEACGEIFSLADVKIALDPIEFFLSKFFIHYLFF